MFIDGAGHVCQLAATGGAVNVEVLVVMGLGFAVGKQAIDAGHHALQAVVGAAECLLLAVAGVHGLALYAKLAATDQRVILEYMVSHSGFLLEILINLIYGAIPLLDFPIFRA